MSITTYSELQTAIGTWLGRSDLSTVATDFITMFEAHANRVLRVRQMVVTTTLEPSTSGVAALPTDYLQWRRATLLASSRSQLEYRTPDYILAAFPNAGDTGTPVYFTVEGSDIYFRPVDASSTHVELLYYQKIPVLSSTNTSNWLLAAHPDAYLFGALVEAQAYVVDPDKLALWKARRDEVLGTIQALSNAQAGGGAIQTYGWVV